MGNDMFNIGGRLRQKQYGPILLFGAIQALKWSLPLIPIDHRDKWWWDSLSFINCVCHTVLGKDDDLCPSVARLQGRCTCLEARMVDMVTMLSSSAAVTSSTLPKMNASFTSLKETTVKSMVFHFLLMWSSRSSRAASWLASMLNVATSGCRCTTCVQHMSRQESIPQTFFLTVTTP